MDEMEEEEDTIEWNEKGEARWVGRRRRGGWKRQEKCTAKLESPSPPLLSNLIPMEEETKMEWRRDQSKDSYLHLRKWMGSVSATSIDPRERSRLSTKSNKGYALSYVAQATYGSSY